MRKRILLLLFVIGSGLMAIAGLEGTAPAEGSYTFTRLEPEPEEIVGMGQFTSDASGDSLIAFSAGGRSDWKRDEEDGNYTRVPRLPGDLTSICFHENSEPPPEYTYELKWDGDTISNGKLADLPE